jgi:hypothetical protein
VDVGEEDGVEIHGLHTHLRQPPHRPASGLELQQDPLASSQWRTSVPDPASPLNAGGPRWSPST